MFDFEMVLHLAGIVAFVLAAVAMLYLMPFLKAKIGDEKLKELWKMVCIAVQAAEQIFGSGKGVDKKEYALEYLDANGATKLATPEQLDALIEAAVYDLT